MPKITQKMIDEARDSLEAQENIPASALEKHISAFGKLEAGKILYSRHTIADKLKNHGESNPGVVGTVINFFNAVHSGKCPFADVTFSPSETNDFASSLHLGTVRLYRPDGSFDEKNWNDFAKDKEMIALSELLDYLSEKNTTLAEQHDTGRNTDSWLSSRTVQETAGREAWKEVFKILVCDWQTAEGGVEPLIQSDLLRLFFEDSPACLEVATKLSLPVAEPSQDELINDVVNTTPAY